MKMTLPVEIVNERMKEGKFTRLLTSILQNPKPEAVCFTTSQGKRTVFLVHQMKEASEMIKYAEPWFLSFNAEVEFYPVMVPEDLGKADQYIDSAVKEFA